MKLCLDKVFLWIKKNHNFFNIVSGCFFISALFTGAFWLYGYEIEPLAFVLLLLAQISMYFPPIAEFFQPNRKPVKNMVLQEIMDFIPTTDPCNDWHGVSLDWSSEVYLKEDPRLRFRANYSGDGVQNPDFKDPWANLHPSQHAIGYWYNLYYDGQFLDRSVLVSVDGGRARIPPPDWESNKISLYDYKVAQIHDDLGTLDQYILRSKLSVES